MGCAASSTASSTAAGEALAAEINRKRYDEKVKKEEEAQLRKARLAALEEKRKDGLIEEKAYKQLRRIESKRKFLVMSPTSAEKFFGEEEEEVSEDAADEAALDSSTGKSMEAALEEQTAFSLPPPPPPTIEAPPTSPPTSSLADEDKAACDNSIQVNPTSPTLQAISSVSTSVSDCPLTRAPIAVRRSALKKPRDAASCTRLKSVHFSPALSVAVEKRPLRRRSSTRGDSLSGGREGFW